MSTGMGGFGSCVMPSGGVFQSLQGCVTSRPPFWTIELQNFHIVLMKKLKLHKGFHPDCDLSPFFLFTRWRKNVDGCGLLHRGYRAFFGQYWSFGLTLAKKALYPPCERPHQSPISFTVFSQDLSSIFMLCYYSQVPIKQVGPNKRE